MERVFGYCPNCQNYDRNLVKLENYKITSDLSNIEFQAVCIICGSLIKLTYDLGDVSLIHKGDKKIEKISGLRIEQQRTTETATANKGNLMPSRR